MGIDTKNKLVMQYIDNIIKQLGERNIKVKEEERNKALEMFLDSDKDFEILKKEIDKVVEEYVERYLRRLELLKEIREQRKYDKLEQELNEKAKEYLPIISKDYGQNMNQKQLEKLKELVTSNNVVVEYDNEEYKKNQGEEYNGTYLAHGSKVFNDGKVHFYPFILDNQDPEYVKKNCEAVLLHELFHYFIDPGKMDTKGIEVLKDINRDTSEALVDLCTRDTNMKYGINQDYSSNYANNVIFMREALNNIPDKNKRMDLVFNGSVLDIYENTSNDNYNSYQNYVDTKNKNTEFNRTISNYAISYVPEHKSAAENKMLDIAANCENKEQALSTIGNMFENKQSNNESLDNSKKLVRTPQNSDNGNKANGFVSTLILCLITGFVMGVVAAISYILISS